MIGHQSCIRRDIMVGRCESLPYSNREYYIIGTEDRMTLKRISLEKGEYI